MTDLEKKKSLKTLEKEKNTMKKDMIDRLKHNFKHIHGMWPKTAKFENEAQRMQSWQTTSVIKQKIFNPSKRLIICQQGCEELNQKKLEYDEFLKKFRSPNAKGMVNDKTISRPEGMNLMGSFTNSSLGTRSNDRDGQSQKRLRQSVASIKQINTSLRHSVEHINSSSVSLIKYADGDSKDNESQTYSSFKKQKLATEESPTESNRRHNNKLLLKYKPGEYTMFP